VALVQLIIFIVRLLSVCSNKKRRENGKLESYQLSGKAKKKLKGIKNLFGGLNRLNYLIRKHDTLIKCVD
jgi:hypothetical protein